MKHLMTNLFRPITEFFTYLVAFTDEFIMINWEKVKRHHSRYWWALLAYFIFMLLTLALIYLGLVLLYQSFLTKNTVVYVIFFVVLLLSFWFTYRLMIYTPAILRNTGYYLKQVMAQPKPAKTVRPKKQAVAKKKTNQSSKSKKSSK